MSFRNGRSIRLEKRSAILLAAASAVGGLYSSCFGLSNTFTYTAGGTSWTNSGAWLFNNPFPNGPGEIANFTTVDLAPIGPTLYPVTLDTLITVGQLNFADANTASPGGWQILQGGSSTLTLNTGNASVQPIINVGGMGTNLNYSLVDIAAPIYGTSGYIKQGAGRLRLSGDNGISGSISIQGGTLEVSSVNNLGTLTDSTILMAGGTLSLRSDTALNLNNRNLVVTANSTLDVNRSITGGVTSIIDSIGTITMGLGSRALTVTGSNFFGVSVGTMVIDTGNTTAVINELAPGQLTIGNVITPGLTGASTITFGGTNTFTTGNNLVITNSITQTAPAAALSVIYSDNHTLTVGSFVSVTGNLVVSGAGTMLLNAGQLPTGSLGVSSGTLDFSATNMISTVTHLQMGGGTASYINSGASTSSGLAVSGNITFSASAGGLGGVIDGKLLLGSAAHAIQVNGVTGIPTQELTVNAVTSGSGTLNKGGTGQILLTGANALTGTLMINQGTFAGVARSSGNALSVGAVTISGGALRLVNQSTFAGSGSIGSLDFNGAATNPAFLVVDSGDSNTTTTLNIGTFLGRAANTAGALTIIPKNGGLNSTEVITAASIATAVGTTTNHGILAPYVAAQVSATNSSIDFLATSGTHIVGGAAAYTTGEINSAGANSVYATTSGQTLTGNRQMFALKADGIAAAISSGGSNNITLGDGALAGLIVNNGAQINPTNLVLNANESIFWAGGRVLDVDGTSVLAAGGTIGANVSFATTSGALTTSGSQTLTLAGTLDLSGQTRTVTVSNGTAVISGAVSNGSMIKSGPNYMILTNANGTMTGTFNAASGTLQIGQGASTPLASIGLSSINVGNGNVVINLDGLRTISNFITSSGAGALIVDSPTGIIRFSNGLSNYSSLTVQGGGVQLSSNGQIPSGATLTVQNGASFDLAGFTQTVGSLAGTVGTGIVTNSGAGLSTLTLNVNNTLSPNFGGQILSGVGNVVVSKTGTGTQILSGSSTYTGGTRLVAGVLQLNASAAAGTGSIQFVGGTLALGGGANVANPLSIGSSTGTITIAPGSNTGTLSGPINVSNGTLVVNFTGSNGTLSVLAAALSPSVFSGTILATGVGSGVFRIPANTDASAASIIWGNSTSQIALGSTTTVGFLSGGASGSILTGQLSVGALGGQSSWNGTITTGTVTKVGPGTFTLSSTTNKNHTINNLNSNSGALVVGQNAQLTNGINVTMNGGDLYFAGNANFTNTATVNLSTNGVWDVTQVPGGYAGAASLTVRGTGNIRGAYIHGSGTLSPGGPSRAGTITFNSLASPAPLTMSNGLVQLDFGNSGLSSVGGGTNDLLVVNGDVNFNPNTFYRFNYIGTGSVNAGDDFPFMYYTGSKTGWGAGSISATAGKVRSAFRADMVLKEMSPGIIAAHVSTVGGLAQTLRWTGSTSGIWDLNLTSNFKDASNNGVTFFQLDTVVFDDSAIARPTANLETAVFLPAQVIVNNGSNAAGVIRIGSSGNPDIGQVGTLAGSMQLIKRGTGQLELNSYNTYTGGTVLEAGTLVLSYNRWAERDFDHAQPAPAGVGSIMFTSTTGAATMTVNNNTPNEVNVPAGVIANITRIGGSNGAYFTAPWTGSGTINLWGNPIGPINFRNTLDFFTGTINVATSINYLQPQSLGNNAYWNFVTPQTVAFNWSADQTASDNVAFDINMAGLNGQANIASAASNRRPGNLHIGSGNGNSLWTGNSQDATQALGAGNGIMSLTKEGTGSLIMTGSHGYTGDTIVNGGVMELSNTGGPQGTPLPGMGIMTGTRVVRVHGGTFRLGTTGGGVNAGNAGTITTATTGLLLTTDAGGAIDVANSYDEVNGDGDYIAFRSAPGVTWAGNGTVVGDILHEAGTISPGRDSGFGTIGTLTFANTLKLYNGAVSIDVGSTSSSADRINADTLLVSGSTVIVNVVGNSIPANGTYTFLHSGIGGNSTTDFGGIIVKGRGATGTFQQTFDHQNFMIKMLTAGVSDRITWNGGAGATWDVKGGANWLNHNAAPDYFYHGDTVTFTDTGAGTVNLASNLIPAGEILVNNTSTTYTFAGAGKISGAASLHKTGAGTMKILSFNDYTGGTTIDAGGTVILGNDNVYSNNSFTTAPSNTQILGNHGGQLGTGSVVNNGTLVIAGATAMAVPNNISGNGAVYFRDIGWTRLDGTNSWLGGTTISNGAISLGHDNALPTNGSLNFVAMDRANLYAAGGSSFNQQVVRLDMRGFSQTILELNSFGATLVNGGAGTSNVIYNSNAGTQQISTLTIGRTGPNGWHGIIRENLDGDSAPMCLVALTKMSDGSEGGGIATIDTTGMPAAANNLNYNYGGVTNINAGTYIFIGWHTPGNYPAVSGGRIESSHSFGTYTVASGAALGGNYQIYTTVTVQPGGKIAPGWDGATSAHTAQQDFLNLNSAELHFGLYGFTSDQIAIPWDNGLTLSGVSQVFLNATNVQAGTFTLMDYSGAAIPDLLSKIQLHPLNITNPGTFTYTLVNDIVNTSLDLVVTQPVVSTTWRLDNNGSWGTGANWTSDPTTPNAFGSTANFGSISAPRVVTMDGPFNIGTANFTSSAGFTILGSGDTTLTLGNLSTGSSVGINLTAGSHAINVPVQWNNDGTVLVSGGQLTIGGGFGLSANGNFSGHNITKDGSGTLLADSVRNTFGNDGAASFRVKQGVVQMIHHPSANASAGTSKVNSLTIDNGAKLDLTNNALVLDYAGFGGGSSILTQLRGWLKSSDGRLYSSEADATHGLGYKDNFDSSGAGNAAVGNFSGVTVDVSSILIKYTYLGDTNVDGQVDISDLYNLATNYNPKHIGSANSIWQKGDFNYDGWVDLADLTKLTTNWQAGVGNPLGSPLGPILASLGLPSNQVPEPAMIGLVTLGLTGLLARRRRRT